MSAPTPDVPLDEQIMAVNGSPSYAETRVLYFERYSKSNVYAEAVKNRDALRAALTTLRRLQQHMDDAAAL